MTANEGRQVAVIGLGYVGLVLAVGFAEVGRRVIGFDVDQRVREAIRSRRAPFFEPGVQQALERVPADRLSIVDRLPDALPDDVVICVGTPLHPEERRPDLRAIERVANDVSDRLSPDTLVVVRSTVPLGTCRNLVLPILRRRVPEPLLAYCPERTMQGRALEEIRRLPQIIGAHDARSLERAQLLFSRIASSQVPVSTLETAEMVKLACNAHTYVIYGFGNEIGLIATALGLDAEEVIASANLGYPRPDLCRPGYVGGSCLTKDPHLLMHASANVGHVPEIVSAACSVNESIPDHVARRVAQALRTTGRQGPTTAFVCGVAYKGQPQTDDVRGSAAPEIARLLSRHVDTLRAHDFLVPRARIAAMGYEPVEFDEGLIDADALLLLIDHPGYASLDLEVLKDKMRRPPVIFDVWGVWKDALEGADDVVYLRLGRG